MNIYQYDGSLEGLLSCIFEIYETKAVDRVGGIDAGPCRQAGFGDEYIRVETDGARAARVGRGILRHIGRDGLDEVTQVFHCADAEKDLAIFRYLVLAFRHGRRVTDMVSNPHVFAFQSLLYNFSHECHRFTGFVRFRETAGGVMYAPIAPDHNILAFLLPHFIKRFQNMAFGIYDVNRRLLALYNGKEYRILPLEEDPEVEFAAGELDFQALWQRYYNDVSIETRKSERRRRNFMPYRYWRFLPEMVNDIAPKAAESTETAPLADAQLMLTPGKNPPS